MGCRMSDTYIAYFGFYFTPLPAAGLAKRTKMQRTRHPLRLSIDSSSKDYHLLQPTNNSTPDSGSPGSSTESTAYSTANADWRICSVLCLHDYTSDDPSHLSFTRNEILEIVQQEETGWWAALRLEENHVGWISRYVFAIVLNTKA